MTPSPDSPPIEYLARDYTGLRQMLLDRFSVQIPAWTERHTADLEIALVELLAYAGDYLSYYQDAVAAEAYLMTARQRISLRRHARLLDYAIDDGLNSRVFVRLTTAEDHVVVPAHTPPLTEAFGDKPAVSLEGLNGYNGIVFKTMHPIELFRKSNSMQVEPEAAGEWKLPAGRTSLFLSGDITHLRKGDLLLLQASVARFSGHVVRLAKTPATATSPLGRPSVYPEALRTSTVERRRKCAGRTPLPTAGRCRAERRVGSGELDACMPG